MARPDALRIGRRGFLRLSGGTLIAGPMLLARAAAGDPRRVPAGGPVLELPARLESIDVDGLPFAPWFTGDDWTNEEIPFHGPIEGGPPAGRVEEADVVVVGGGISGLGSAMLLRDANPVVLEMRRRFGGAAQGERWGGTAFSLGNAYVITPDPGTFLESFYASLGMPDAVRVDTAPPPMELEGRLLEDFFDPQSHPPHERAAYNKYRQVVRHMANVTYPDIPVPPGPDGDWIVELDQRSFRADIEDRMHMPIPDALASWIQAYCYSSFAAGWEEISAAGGWNFLAAEEFGRWVLPGGTSWMAQRMWETLVADLGDRVRPQALVSRVALAPGDRVEVTYVDADRAERTVLARQVVMAAPKLVAKTILADLPTVDPGKLEAMQRLDYRAYVVANVILDLPVDLDFYDIFLLQDGTLPMNMDDAQAESRVIDVLNGHFTPGPGTVPAVLTLYWPLPFDFGRWTLLIETSWQDYAEALVPQVDAALGLLGLGRSAVRQVRLTRWAHAMPINRPGLMADGTIEALRRPLDDRVHFVHQDNWALPAVENCLLDAQIVAPQVLAALGRATR